MFVPYLYIMIIAAFAGVGVEATQPYYLGPHLVRSHADYRDVGPHMLKVILVLPYLHTCY
jgi:hypothetical protein